MLDEDNKIMPFIDPSWRFDEEKDTFILRDWSCKSNQSVWDLYRIQNDKDKEVFKETYKSYFENKDTKDIEDEEVIEVLKNPKTDNPLKEFKVKTNKNLNKSIKDMISENTIDKVTESYLVFNRDEKNKDTYYKNLRITLYDDKYYTSGLVGVVWLKDRNDNNIKTNRGNNAVLIVNPRFSNLDSIKMYLKVTESDYYCTDIKDKLNKKIVHYFMNDPPILFEGNAFQQNSLFTVTVFLRQLKDLCSKNIKHQMTKVEENLVGKVKGKIIFNKQIKHNIVTGRLDRIYCQYQTFDFNTKENQILKEALKRAKKYLYNMGNSQVNSELLDMAGYCERILQPVESVRISSKDFNGLKNTGMFAHYKLVLENARRIIDSITIAYNGNVEHSGYVMPFAINIELLFELYVRVLLYKYLNIENKYKYTLEDYDKSTPTLKAFDSSDEVKSKDGDTEPKDKVKKMMLHVLNNVKPDIVLTNSNNSEDKVVLDVKYKAAEKVARDDTHQIFSYAKLFDTKHVGFIFPHREEGYTAKFLKYINLDVEKDYERFTQISKTEGGKSNMCFPYKINTPRDKDNWYWEMFINVGNEEDESIDEMFKELFEGIEDTKNK